MKAPSLLESMRIFRRVIELGSFTRAAKDLRISTAWASRHVERLERHLGATLLHRTTRRLRVTAAGERCYDTAGALLDELTALESDLGEAAGIQRGRVRIGAPMSFTLCELAPVIAEFCSAHPAIDIELVLNDRFVDLVEAGLDLNLRLTSALADSGFIARKLASVRLIACAAPRYLAKHGTPSHPRDLRTHRCLVYSLPAQGVTWSFKERGRSLAIHPPTQVLSNNSLALRPALLAGMGIAYIPEFIVREDLASGSLIPILTQFLAEPMALYLLRHADRRQPKRVSALADYLIAKFSDASAHKPMRAARNS